MPPFHIFVENVNLISGITAKKLAYICPKTDAGTLVSAPKVDYLAASSMNCTLLVEYLSSYQLKYFTHLDQYFIRNKYISWLCCPVILAHILYINICCKSLYLNNFRLELWSFYSKANYKSPIASLINNLICPNIQAE